MLKTKSNRKSSNQSTSHASANTMFEPLEQRQMMSATFFGTSVYAQPLDPPVLHAPVAQATATASTLENPTS